MFFSFVVNFCFVFVILNIKIFCRSSNWRNRYAECHSYRDTETIAAEVMKVIIYLVSEVCIILWNLSCSIGCKSYFYFIPHPSINHFPMSRMISFWKEKKKLMKPKRECRSTAKLALLNYSSKLCCVIQLSKLCAYGSKKRKCGNAWDPARLRPARVRKEKGMSAHLKRER